MSHESLVIREYQKINYLLCRGADGARELRSYIQDLHCAVTHHCFGEYYKLEIFLIGSPLDYAKKSNPPTPLPYKGRGGKIQKLSPIRKENDLGESI